MLIRDDIQPLRVLAGSGDGDKVTPDPAELVALLRQIGGSSGIQG
jgi:hypothetical protein